MCDAYFDSGKYRGPETDPDGWHVRAVLGVKKELKRKSFSDNLSVKCQILHTGTKIVAYIVTM